MEVKNDAPLSIDVANGKYKIVLDEDFNFYAEKSDGKRMDLAGNGMVLAMAREIDSLRKKVEKNG